MPTTGRPCSRRNRRERRCDRRYVPNSAVVPPCSSARGAAHGLGSTPAAVPGERAPNDPPELVPVEPTHEATELRPAGRIEPVGLRRERDERSAPGVVLPAQPGAVAAVPVKDDYPRVVDERQLRPEDAVHHVDVAASGERRAGVEGVVELPEPERDLAADRHVGARTEHAGVVGVDRVTGAVEALVTNLDVSAPETTASLERDLRVGLELQRQDLAGHHARVGMTAPDAAECVEPVRVDQHVVVDKGDHVAAR